MAVVLTLLDRTVDPATMPVSEWVDVRRTIHDGAVRVMADADGKPMAYLVEHVVRWMRLPDGTILADTAERPVPEGETLYSDDIAADRDMLTIAQLATRRLQHPLLQRLEAKLAKRATRKAKAATA